MNSPFLALLSAVGPLSIALLLIVLGLLSQRLGAVTKATRYYWWFFVAAGLVGVSVGARLLGATATETDVVVALVYITSLTLGLTIGLVVAWRYWNWLFREQGQ